MGRFNHRDDEGDYYTQPGNLFRLMDKAAQQRLCSNIAGGLSGLNLGAAIGRRW